MARRRRRSSSSRSFFGRSSSGRSSSNRVWVIGFLITAAGVWTYARYVSPLLEGSAEPAKSTDSVADATSSKLNNIDLANTELAKADTGRRKPIPRLTSRRPEISDGGAGRDVVEKGAVPNEQPIPKAEPKLAQNRERANQLFAAGTQAESRGELLAAREHFTEAVQAGLAHEQLIEARAALTRIGTETIFGPTILKDDPYVSRYTIKEGDSLGKIAKNFAVSDDFLAAINNIPDKNRIRLGQNIKVVHGPFHARINLDTFSMDIYLDQTFVRHYKVGLGKDGGTPAGEWRVGDKMVNPTYFPPRGGKVMAGDDPDNPLGERWIELIGVGGGAVGQTSFGIHGTIEPNTIGKNASMGCIRMHNADVAEVFTFLASQKSTVLTYRD